ncbi:hypothetical protein C8Q76DRAFT_694847 [Earliella scabrosa]|nr:hypothetical protein C8Q76DRAFT_694847 [Earliella scabrosa]
MMRQTLLQAVRSNEREVMEFDAKQGVLKPWKWPARFDSTPIAPGSLRQTRMRLDFLGPSCLCTSLRGGVVIGVEAAILIEVSGPWSGEYVAKCAEASCGYVEPGAGGPSVLRASREDQRSPRPRPVYHRTEDADNVFPLTLMEYNDCQAVSDAHRAANVRDVLGVTSSHNSHPGCDSTPTRQKRRMTEANDENQPLRFVRPRICDDLGDVNVPLVIPGRAPVPRPHHYTSSLRKLDSVRHAGIPEDRFRWLFVKCRECRLSNHKAMRSSTVELKA